VNCVILTFIAAVRAPVATFRLESIDKQKSLPYVYKFEFF